MDAKLAGYSNTAAMNSPIASASTYALRAITDQLALDLAAKQSGVDVDSKIAMALLDRPSDVDQKVATALLTCVTQVALDAALAPCAMAGATALRHP